MGNDPAQPSPDRFKTPKTSQISVIDVRELLAGAREAIIVHAGERYRLRITAKDKLILTK
jgi:hemin uptake protein HemP